jgi:hypothetical protein
VHLRKGAVAVLATLAIANILIWVVAIALFRPYPLLAASVIAAIHFHPGTGGTEAVPSAK